MLSNVTVSRSDATFRSTALRSVMTLRSVGLCSVNALFRRVPFSFRSVPFRSVPFRPVPCFSKSRLNNTTIAKITEC